MRSKGITIKDIGRELGMSPSTVSRALTGSEVVKKETREVIQKYAKEHGYVPNYTALSLKNRSTKTIGVIVPVIIHEFFAFIIRGIEDYAYANNYSVIICSSHNSYEREVMDTKTLTNGRVDGILACIGRETKKYDHFDDVIESHIPLVFFDNVRNEIKSPKVVIDDLDAGYKATKHLIEQGCKKIVFIGGPEHLLTNINRLAGFKKAYNEASLDFNKNLILNIGDGDDFDEGKALCENLLTTDEFDGLFAATDMIAIGAMKALKKANKRIPEDVAVIGFSNWTISKIYEPSLSTISQPGYEMGYQAAEMLIHQIKTDGIDLTEKRHVLGTEVVPRESSQRNLV